MGVKLIRSLIQGPQGHILNYLTCDGTVFPDMDSAIDYDNKYHETKTNDADYEQIWTVQEAINKATTENKVVRYLTDKSNAVIKKEIVDLKGCKLMKPYKDSRDVAVVPPGINNFSFNDVDTTVTVRGD